MAATTTTITTTHPSPKKMRHKVFAKIYNPHCQRYNFEDPTLDANLLRRRPPTIADGLLPEDSNDLLAKELITRMLTFDPPARPSASVVANRLLFCMPNEMVAKLHALDKSLDHTDRRLEAREAALDGQSASGAAGRHYKLQKQERPSRV